MVRQLTLHVAYRAGHVERSAVSYWSLIGSHFPIFGKKRSVVSFPILRLQTSRRDPPFILFYSDQQVT